jgi:hypothetical protein
MMLYAQRHGDLPSILIRMQYRILIILQLTYSIVNSNTTGIGFQINNMKALSMIGLYQPNKPTMDRCVKKDLLDKLTQKKLDKNTEPPFRSLLINPPLINYQIHPKTLHLLTHFQPNNACIDVTKSLKSKSNKKKPKKFLIENQIATLLRHGKLAKCDEQRIVVPSYQSREKIEIIIPSISSIENQIEALIKKHHISIDWKDKYGTSLLFIACENNILSIIPKFLNIANKQKVPICFYGHRDRLPLDVLLDKINALNTDPIKNKEELKRCFKTLELLNHAQNNTQLFKKVDAIMH